MIFDEIISNNVNGLATDKKKRVEKFRWLKKQSKGIFCLQETHSSIKMAQEWNNQYGHDYVMYYSHGTTDSCGVCTVIPKRYHRYVVDVQKDNNGRCLIISFEFDSEKYIVINVYFPTQNFPKDQITYIDVLDEMVKKYEDHKVIICGDFNIVQNPKLDKWCATESTPSKVAQYLENFKLKNHLIDIWRTMNPTKNNIHGNV